MITQWPAESVEELYLCEMLAVLQRNYEAAAKPIIDRLALIQAYKQPTLLITTDEARELGLL